MIPDEPSRQSAKCPPHFADFSYLCTMKKLLIVLTLFCSLSLCGQSIDTVSIRAAVERQMTDYPLSTLQDVYKSFYQEHFGPGHMISDTTSVRRYLLHELSEMGETITPYYYEPTGNQGAYVRVCLSAVADSLISSEQLLEAFIESANSWQKPDAEWSDKWKAIVKVVKENGMEMDGFDTDLPLLNEAARNSQAVHHSRRYNEAYHPHYRIVERRIFEERLLPLISK